MVVVVVVATDVAHSMVCVSVYVLVMSASPAKTAELIKMPFGRQTQVDQRNHVLYRANMSTIWQIQLNDLCSVVMQALATIAHKQKKKQTNGRQNITLVNLW